jgi:hypothetical protein
MIIYITIIILLVLFYKYYGNKKGFNKLETNWIFFTLLYFILFYNLNAYNRVILLLFVLCNKTLMLPIFTMCGVVLSIILEKFKTYRIVSLFLYKNLNLNMNIKDLPSKPTIIVANYPSNYIEYLTHGLFGDKLCLLVYGPAVKILKYIYGKDHLIAVNKGNFEKTQEEVKHKLDSGYHIFAYVEKDYYNRKNPYTISELRTGMFSIAKNLNVTITPVTIDHIDHLLGGVNTNSIFNIKIGKTEYVNDIDKSIKQTREFFNTNLRKMCIPRSIDY